MNHPQDIDMFLKTVTKFRHEKGIAGNLFFGDIESDVLAKSSFIKKQSDQLELMVKNYIFILVKINVLKYASKLLSSVGGNDLMTKDPSESLLSHLRLCYMGGFIKRSEQTHFEKIIFRASRGKAYATFITLEISKDDQVKSSEDLSQKVVYVVIFEDGVHLKERMRKICTSAGEAV